MMNSNSCINGNLPPPPNPFINPLMNRDDSYYESSRAQFNKGNMANQYEYDRSISDSSSFDIPRTGNAPTNQPTFQPINTTQPKKKISILQDSSVQYLANMPPPPNDISSINYQSSDSNTSYFNPIYG